jgi:hypothetical protein
VNTVAPSISGTAQDGQTLTASQGSWTGTQPISYAYQWQRCDSGGANCSNIASATSTTYTLTSADVGSTLVVSVTATNTAGQATASSSPSAVVAAAPPVNTSLPTVLGTAQQGQTLSASQGGWSGTAPDQLRVPVAALRLERGELREHRLGDVGDLHADERRCRQHSARGGDRVEYGRTGDGVFGCDRGCAAGELAAGEYGGAVDFGDGAGWADADGQSGQLDGHAADQLRLPVAAL